MKINLYVEQYLLLILHSTKLAEITVNPQYFMNQISLLQDFVFIVKL